MWVTQRSPGPSAPQPRPQRPPLGRRTNVAFQAIQGRENAAAFFAQTCERNLILRPVSPRPPRGLAKASHTPRHRAARGRGHTISLRTLRLLSSARAPATSPNEPGSRPGSAGFPSVSSGLLRATSSPVCQLNGIKPRLLTQLKKLT